MGVAKLEISSDISALLARMDSLEASVRKLTGETDNYTERATAGFDKVAQSSNQLKTEIKEQEKIIKDMTREAEKLAKTQTKHTDEQAKAYKRLQGDIKVANQELKGMKTQQEQVQASAGKGSAIFQKLGGAIAAAFTVGAVVNFIKKAGEAWMLQERAEAKLKVALGGRYSVQQKLIEQSKELQKTTLFKDEEIINAQALLGTMIKDSETIKKLTPLVLDLAAAKGIDLTSAAQRVGKAVVGSTMELAKMGLKIEGTAGTTERLTSVIDGLTTAFGGQSAGQNVGLTGSVDTFRDSWNELLESFGELEKSGQGVIPFLGGLVGKIAELNNAIAKTGWGNFFSGLQNQLWGDDLNTVQAQLEKFQEGLVSGSNEIARRVGLSTKPLKELQDELIAAADSNIKFQESQVGGGSEAVVAYWKAYKQSVIGYSTEVKKANEDASEAAKKAADEAEKAAKEAAKKAAEIREMFEKQAIERAQDLQKWIHDLSDEDVVIDVSFDVPDPKNIINDAWKATYGDVTKFAQSAFDSTVEGQRNALNAQLAQLEEFRKYAPQMAEQFDVAVSQIQEKLENLYTFSEKYPIAGALGFTSEDQLNQIKDYSDQILDYVNELVDQEVEARTRLVEDWNQKIDEQQELVNREQEDKAEGLANNYELEKENLANMQKARDQAVKDREKSIKLQRTMSTIESGIALVSAAANIIKGFSEIPIVGVILGLLAVGAMIAGFIAASASAKSATKMEGGGRAEHGLLKGKRHSQGGIPIEAEEGEWFINRKSSVKYSPLLEAINKDDQRGMKLFFDRKYLTRMPEQTSFDIDKSKKLGEITRLMKKGKADITYGNGFIIERIGGYTKKINLN